MTTVSVIVATRNRREMLARCMDSLCCQDYPGSLTEVVVVDDGSTDGTPGYLEALDLSGPELKTILRPEQGWQSEARNCGIAASSGQVVLITDDDCTVPPNWISSSVKAQATLGLDMVGGRVRAPGDSLMTRYLDHIRILDPVLLPDGSPAYLVTANAAFSRRAIDAVGLFDPVFSRSGGEDVEISLRARMRRLRLGFSPDVCVNHWYSPDLSAFLGRSYRYGLGSRAVFDKHRHWEFFIPDAWELLHDYLTGAEAGRSFYEITDPAARAWFKVLFRLQMTCYLAGYLHIAGDARDDELPVCALRGQTAGILDVIDEAARTSHSDAWAELLRDLCSVNGPMNGKSWGPPELDLMVILARVSSEFSREDADHGVLRAPRGTARRMHKRSAALAAKYRQVDRQMLNVGGAESLDFLEALCDRSGVDLNSYLRWQDRNPTTQGRAVSGGIFRRRRAPSGPDPYPY